MARTFDDLLADLRSPKWVVRLEAVWEMRDMAGDLVVDPLISALADSDDAVAGVAADVLVSRGRGGVPLLLAALRHGDGRLRRLAATTLGLVNDPESAEGLAESLADPNSDVRSAAALSLAQLGDVRAVEPLVELLSASGPVDTSHLRIAHLLGSLAEPRTLRALIPLLDHDHSWVRGAAIEAMGLLGETAAPAIPLLARLIQDPGQSLHHRACREALRRIEAALRHAPAELEAAPMPEGRGTEVEAAARPAGRGTEVEAAPPPHGRGA